MEEKKLQYLILKEFIMIAVKLHLNSLVVHMIVNTLSLVKWKIQHSLCGLLTEKDLLLGLKSNSNNWFKLLLSSIEVDNHPEKETKKLKSDFLMAHPLLLDLEILMEFNK